MPNWDEYPCGCRPGEFLCKEAEKLWRESIEFSKEGNWKAYEVKRREYDWHYKGQEAVKDA